MYEFRVACFNELGNSSLSAASKSVSTRATGGSGSVPEIFGLGHEVSFPERSDALVV